MPPKRRSGQTEGPEDGVRPQWSACQHTSTAAAREHSAAIEIATPQNTAKKTSTARMTLFKAKPKTKVKQGDDGTDGQQPASAGDGTGKANGVKAEATKVNSTGTKTEIKDVNDPGRQY